MHRDMYARAPQNTKPATLILIGGHGFGIGRVRVHLDRVPSRASTPSVLYGPCGAFRAFRLTVAYHIFLLS